MGERGWLSYGLAQGRFGEADVSRHDETKKGELAFGDVQRAS